MPFHANWSPIDGRNYHRPSEQQNIIAQQSVLDPKYSVQVWLATRRSRDIDASTDDFDACLKALTMK